MTLYAYTDGASRGNPGESGIGIVLKDEAGKTLFTVSKYIGTATNNVAEYTALVACLEKVMELKCDRLVVHSDSELMVRQLEGAYRVKDKNLQRYVAQVKKLLAAAPFAFSIKHVDRERNGDADLLANAGIDNKDDVLPS